MSQNKYTDAQMMDIRRHVENCKRWTNLAQNLVTYMRTDHVGMIKGDGDLSRYLNYLVSNANMEASAAQRAVEIADLPHELPF